MLFRSQLDKHAFLASLSSDPTARPVFAEVFKMLKENNEIDERIAGQQILNQDNRLKAIANMLVPLQRKVTDGEPIETSDLSGAIALGINNGAFKNREDGLRTLTSWTGISKNSPSAAKDIVLRMSQFTDNSRAALKQNMLDMETAYKMVPQTTEMGESFEQPAYQVPGLLPPGAPLGKIGRAHV